MASLLRGTSVTSYFLWGALLLGCGSPSRAPNVNAGVSTGKPVPSSRLPATSDAFVRTDCEFRSKEYATECGYVLVPEGGKSERTVALSVLRIFSNAKSPREPIIYLEGGPGGAALANAENYVGVFSTLLEERDIVLFDQRGIGASLPSLECESPELGKCFSTISKETDPSSYRTSSNAKDVDEIRKALGYEKWVLYGISYGTRLGLTVLRDHPEGVLAAVLDSVVPLEVDLFAGLAKNGQAAFEKVFADCESDASCGERYPDLLDKLVTSAAALSAEPADIGAGKLDGDTYVSLLFNFLYSPKAIELVPLIITDVARGDYDIFESLASGVSSSQSSFSFPMHISVQCADEFPFTSRDAIELGDAEVVPAIRDALSGRDYLEYCAEWPVTPSPSRENEPVESSVPQLYFAGAYDPITPVEYARIAYEAQPNAAFVEVPTGSHGASVSPCGLGIVLKFLDDPEAELDSDCVAGLPPIVYESLEAPSRFGSRLEFAIERPEAERVEAAIDELRRLR